MRAFSPKHRLDTLFLASAAAMFLVGACGFVEPTSWSYLFDDGGAVAARHIRGRLHLKETIRLCLTRRPVRSRRPCLGATGPRRAATRAPPPAPRPGRFSAFLVGTSYVIFCARWATEGVVRLGVARGLLGASLLTTVVLVQAHQRGWTLSTGAHGAGVVAWSAATSAAFAWFVFCQPPAVYRGLGHDA